MSGGGAGDRAGEGAAHRAIELAARTSYGRLVAVLSARTRDVAAAEDALAHSAAHGGLWRIPYELRSALQLAALAGLPRSLLGRR